MDKEDYFEIIIKKKVILLVEKLLERLPTTWNSYWIWSLKLIGPVIRQRMAPNSVELQFPANQVIISQHGGSKDDDA